MIMNTKSSVIDKIILKGVRVNNLKSIDVDIERGSFIVVTGVSGSGKSSLAFDTLFAEGQRKYIESLSTYARQFIKQIPKPEATSIQGICPTLAIEQKTSTANKRSTVGTSTEIYDYLKLLFARIGKTYSPTSGKIVKRHTIEDVIEYIYSYPSGTRFTILIPLTGNKTIKEELELNLQKGFGRIQVKDEVHFLEDVIEKSGFKGLRRKDMAIIVERNKVEDNLDDHYQRLSDSIETVSFF